MININTTGGTTPLLLTPPEAAAPAAAAEADESVYYDKMNFYVNGLAGSCMVLVGLVCNTLNLIIFSQKSMRSSTTNTYLSAIAICDIFALVFSMMVSTNSFIHDINDFTFESQMPCNGCSWYAKLKLIMMKSFRTWIFELYPRVYPYTYPIAILFQIMTVWVTICMSVDRLIAVKMPLQSLNFCTARLARRAILGVFLFSCVYAAPRFFEHKLVTQTLEFADQTIYTYHYEVTSVGKSELFRQVVYLWMYVSMQSLVPFIMLIIINLALLFTLNESNRMKRILKDATAGRHDNSATNTVVAPPMAGRHSSPKLAKTVATAAAATGSGNLMQKHHNQSDSKKRITIMLITVVLLFIFLQTPAMICNFMAGIFSKRTDGTDDHPQQTQQSSSSSPASQQGAGDTVVCQFGNFFIITCSSVNFFTYNIFNMRFRRELKALMRRVCCCCCCCPKSWRGTSSPNKAQQKQQQTTVLEVNAVQRKTGTTTGNDQDAAAATSRSYPQYYYSKLNTRTAKAQQENDTHDMIVCLSE